MEHFKIFESFFKCSRKNHQVLLMKLVLMRTATGMEDPELPLLQRMSSIDLPASEIAAEINASRSSSNRHISTSTVQRIMCESGLHSQIAANKPLLKDTNKNKKLAWAKKHEQWTLDPWKSVLWSDESKSEIFGSNHCVFVRRKVIGSWVVQRSKALHLIKTRQLESKISDLDSSDQRTDLHRPNVHWIISSIGYYMIPYVLFHRFDVFTIILQCRKKLK